MIRITLTLLPLVFSLAACAETSKVEDDLPGSQTDAVNPTGRTAGESGRVSANPGERPVRIGEGGPRFDACQAVGRVAGIRGGELDVLIAPFDSADKKDSIAEGTRVFICTRSHDQQWFGVVYAEPAPVQAAGEGNELAAPPAMDLADCGVSSPVRSKRNYDGPCQSGWVESNFVKLVAG